MHWSFPPGSLSYILQHCSSISTSTSKVCIFSITRAAFANWAVDIKLVTAPEGETPTRENSKEIGTDGKEGKEEGRGSLVFFNQASMFQSAETDSLTINSAVKGKKKATFDFGPKLYDALDKYGTHFHANLEDV